MTGQWLYRPDIDSWTLLLDGHVEMTIAGTELAKTCVRTGLSRREALAWIATRPRKPWSASAA